MKLCSRIPRLATCTRRLSSTVTATRPPRTPSQQHLACLCSLVNKPISRSIFPVAWVSHRQQDTWLPHKPGGSMRCHASGAEIPKTVSILTLPTLLTIARVIAIPFLIAAWYTAAPWSTTAVTTLFIGASLTDWLDGYLARKMNLSTAFGAFLDPVADKLMVAAVLILLSTQPLAAGPLAGNTWLMPCCTLAIIGREITMSALREWAAGLGGEARSAVAVSSLGKWKTATQMVSLTLLLALRDGPWEGPVGEALGVAGPGLLVVATYLTLLSLVDYLRALWRFLG